MQRIVFLMIFALLLAACSSQVEEQIVEPVFIEEPKVAVVARPRAVQLGDVDFRVITPENSDKILESMNGVGVATSVDDYKTIAKNMQELRRWIAQANGVISYYEDAVSD